jgi:hypothetical protein
MRGEMVALEIPMPSVWESLGIAWMVWWGLLRVLWPYLLIAFVGKLLLVQLERWAERRRLRRWRGDAASDDYGDDYAPAPRRRAVYDYPPDWDVLRRRVYRRARYRCQNCGRRNVELHAHHIVPLSVGGTNALSNLACLCRDCHEAIHPHMRSDTPYAELLRVGDAAQMPDYIYIPDAKLRW